jgi:hypothetical protein
MNGLTLGSTILPISISQRLWNWVKGKLTREEFSNKLLLRTENEGIPAWHVVEKCSNIKLKIFSAYPQVSWEHRFTNCKKGRKLFRNLNPI